MFNVEIMIEKKQLFSSLRTDFLVSLIYVDEPKSFINITARLFTGILNL